MIYRDTKLKYLLRQYAMRFISSKLQNWVPMYIYGTTPAFLTVRDWTDLAEGHAFTGSDIDRVRRVTAPRSDRPTTAIQDVATVPQHRRRQLPLHQLLGIPKQRHRHHRVQSQLRERGVVTHRRFRHAEFPREDCAQPVPEFVLRKAVDIKQELPSAEFYIEHLKEDPFLIVSLEPLRDYQTSSNTLDRFMNDDATAYIEVWAEPKFEAAL